MTTPGTEQCGLVVSVSGVVWNVTGADFAIDGGLITTL